MLRMRSTKSKTMESRLSSLLSKSSKSKHQLGELIVMPKPQTSVWGSAAKNSVASERRFTEK